MKKVDTLYAKAVRLAEGGVVEINGHFVKAIDAGEVDNPCEVCNMDSVCHMEMVDLCAEVNGYTRSPHILKFAYEQN